MTPSFSIERRQAAEVVSWIRDRIPEQKGNAWERERERVKRKARRNFLPFLLDVEGVSRAWRTTAPLPLYGISSAASPSLSLCHSFRSPFDGKDHTRARKMMSFMRARGSRAHTECARAREWPQIVFFVMFDLSLNHLGCYIYKDIFIDLIIKECGEWVERKSEDVFFFIFPPESGENLSRSRAWEARRKEPRRQRREKQFLHRCQVPPYM